MIPEPRQFSLVLRAEAGVEDPLRELKALLKLALRRHWYPGGSAPADGLPCGPPRSRPSGGLRGLARPSFHAIGADVIK
jgi:hypothetical protein